MRTLSIIRYISGSSGLLLLILFRLFSSAFCSTTVTISPLTAFNSFFLFTFLRNASLSWNLFSSFAASCSLSSARLLMPRSPSPSCP